MFLIPIEWQAKAAVTFKQIRYSLGLTLHRNHLKILDIKIAEHMAADIEHQHRVASLEFRERQLFIHFTQRKAVIS